MVSLPFAFFIDIFNFYPPSPRTHTRTHTRCAMEKEFEFFPDLLFSEASELNKYMWPAIFHFIRSDVTQ